MPPRVVLCVLRAVWNVLKPLGKPMTLVGGLALSSWKHPRSTQDVNLLIVVGEDRDELFQRMIEGGFQKKGDDPGQVIRIGEIEVSQWLIELPDSFVPIEVDLLLSKSKFHQQVVERSVPMEIDFENGVTKFRVAACEDLILMKLASSRIIDRADVKQLLELNPDIDGAYLDAWVKQLGLENALDEVRRER